MFVRVVCYFCREGDQLKEAFYEFKVVADQKKVVTDAVRNWLTHTSPQSKANGS